MKFKKTMLSSLVVGSLALSALTGCGTSGTKNASAAGSPSQTQTITFYSGGDTNVQDLWQKDLIPKFEKQNPNIKVRLVFLQHGNGSSTILQKLEAAKKSHQKSVDVDLWEGGSSDITQGEKDGLWTKVNQTDIPNLSKIDPKNMKLVDDLAIPYRASSVVLSYNKDKVKNPPQTTAQLYNWIRQNKGKFAYNDPSTGGAGDSFVTTAIYNFLPPADMAKPYDPSLETKWNQGFKLLKDLAPYMYQGGVYPKGNQGTLDLLAKGDIYMCPAWSDMALQEKANKTLPSNIALTQINPPFTGGPAYLMIPSLSAHKKAAEKFLNFVLTVDAQKEIVDKMYGYPGIKWSEMPASYQDKFKAVAKGYRIFVGGDYSTDMHKLWQEKVVAGQ
ncbi:MAG TPA: extracellular solute-binding protein [Sporolactobacillaceae bacterium]|nr:extracellular solute-binding protein [Sporolactobacillaceae bacterium]